MTSRGVLLRLLMDKLKIDPQLKTFRSRLRLQKTVYLLQRMGMPTDFSYGWYIRGPYSPSLTETAFEEVVKGELREDTSHKDYRLSQDTQEKVNRLEQIIKKKPDDLLSEELWLELLASMLFYKYEMYFPPSQKRSRENADWLYERLPPAKRATFTKHQARKAQEQLAVLGLW